MLLRVFCRIHGILKQAADNSIFLGKHGIPHIFLLIFFTAISVLAQEQKNNDPIKSCFHPLKLSSTSGIPEFPLIGSLGEKIFGLGNVMGLRTTASGEWIITDSFLGIIVWKRQQETWEPSHWFEADQRFYGHHISPDGRFIIIPYPDYFLLCNTMDGSSIARFPKWDKAVFSRDGNFLAVADKNQITIWKAENGQRVASYPVLSKRLELVMDFSSDGQEILVSTDKRSLSRYSLNSGKLLQQYGPLKGNIKQIVYQKNERAFAVVTELSSVHDDTSAMECAVDVYDQNITTPVYSIKTPVLSEYALVPNNLFFIAGCLDGNVMAWDLRNKNKMYDQRAYRSGIQAIAFNRQATLFAMANERDVKIWTFDPIWIQQEWSVPNTRIRNIIFAGDKPQIILTDGSGHLSVHDQDTGKTIQTLEGYQNGILDVQFSPHDSHFAAIENLPEMSLMGKCVTNARVKLWDIESNQCVSVYEAAIFSGVHDNLVAFHPTEDAVIIPDRGPSARIIGWKNGIIRSITDQSGNQKDFGPCKDGFAPWKLSCSRDGANLLINQTILDWQSGQIIHTVSASDGMLEDIFSTEKGFWIFKRGMDKSATTIQIQSLQSDEKIVLPLSPLSFNKAVLSNDVNYLAITSRIKEFSEYEVQLWDIKRKKSIFTLPVKSDSILAISPNEEWLLIEAKNRVIFYHIPTKEIKRELPIIGCSAITFSNDSKQLLTASMYGYTKLWSLKELGL